MPSLPPPSQSPLPPGFSYVDTSATRFTVAVVVSGSVDTFDADAYEANLRTYLSCFEPDCKVELTVSAASVLVTSVVTDTSAETNVKIELAGQLTNATAPAALGVSVESAAQITQIETVSMTVVVAPPPPVSPPPSPPPPAQSPPPPSPESPSLTDGNEAALTSSDDTLGLGLGLGLGLPLVLIFLAVAYYFYRQDQRKRERKQLVIKSVAEQETADGNDEEKSMMPVSTADIVLEQTPMPARTSPPQARSTTPSCLACPAALRPGTPDLRPHHPHASQPNADPLAVQRAFLNDQTSGMTAGGSAKTEPPAPAEGEPGADGEHRRRRRHTHKPGEGGKPGGAGPSTHRKKRSTPRVADPYIE